MLAACLPETVVLLLPAITPNSSLAVNLKTPGLTTGFVSTTIGTDGLPTHVVISGILWGVAGEGGVLLGVTGWLGTSNKLLPLNIRGISLSFFCGVIGLSWLFSGGDLTGVAGLGASIFDSSFSDMDVMSLVSSSSAEPWACDWWYFNPLICLYFFEQFGSGHSNKTGDGGGLLQLFVFVVCWLVEDTTLVFLLFPVWIVALSSSPARLFRLLLGSGLGGTNGVGDDGAVDVPVPLAAAPRLPLTPPPPFLSLLCTDERVSVKLLRSVLGVELTADRPLLPLPFGVRVSRSLVGESQNLI